jgi:hypothetical protein
MIGYIGTVTGLAGHASMGKGVFDDIKLRRVAGQTGTVLGFTFLSTAHLMGLLDDGKRLGVRGLLPGLNLVLVAQDTGLGSPRFLGWKTSLNPTGKQQYAGERQPNSHQITSRRPRDRESLRQHGILRRDQTADLIN